MIEFFTKAAAYTPPVRPVRKTISQYGEDAKNVEARFLARMADKGIIPKSRVSGPVKPPKALKLPPAEPEVEERMRKILATLNKPMQVSEIRKATGIEYRALDRALGRLVSFNMIRKVQDRPGVPATYHPKRKQE